MDPFPIKSSLKSGKLLGFRASIQEQIFEGLVSLACTAYATFFKLSLKSLLWWKKMRLSLLPSQVSTWLIYWSFISISTSTMLGQTKNEWGLSASNSSALQEWTCNLSGHSMTCIVTWCCLLTIYGLSNTSYPSLACQISMKLKIELS